MSATLSQVTLGTTTLGIPYGIANPHDALPANVADAILDCAWDAGITSFDTAPAYGDAETRIGNWRKARGLSPTLATKLPSLSGIPDAEVGNAIGTHIGNSLGRLSATHIAYYLTHDAADFLRPAVAEYLGQLVKDGIIGAFGPSVYETGEVFASLKAGPPGVIQLPLNVLDHRMVLSGALDACRRANIIVFARSILLQGLILMPPEKIPERLASRAAPVGKFQALAAETGCSPTSIALRFARHLPGVSSMIVGVYSVGQLREIVNDAAGEPLPDSVRAAIGEIARDVSASLVDPRSWTR